MRSLLFLLSLTCVSMTLIAQVPTLEPSILMSPNLDAEFLAEFAEKEAAYKDWVNRDSSLEQIPFDENDEMENEEKYWLGPYSTEPMGCSWYCSGGPNKMYASTELDSSHAATYLADNIHDFDCRTAWVEGADGYGIGEEITLQFELGDNLAITQIDIYNGYSKSLKAWKENARVKVFALYINGLHWANLNLVDTHYAQLFDIGELKANDKGILRCTFRILEVYPGELYQDTAVSEINFDGIGDH